MKSYLIRIIVFITIYCNVFPNDKINTNCLQSFVLNWSEMIDNKIDDYFLLNDQFVYKFFSSDTNFIKRIDKIINESTELKDFKPQSENIRALLLFNYDNKAKIIIFSERFDFMKINNLYYIFNWNLFINIMVNYPKIYIEECLKDYEVLNGLQ